MTHASESCAMLIPLALEIFSTLFFLPELYLTSIWGQKKKNNLRVDDFFRSWILAVAFDKSEREKAKVLEKLWPKIGVHTHHSVRGPYHFHKDAKEDREQEGTREENQHPSTKKKKKIVVVWKVVCLDRKATDVVAHWESGTFHALLHDRASCNGFAWR